jgi:hypothetical protein
LKKSPRTETGRRREKHDLPTSPSRQAALKIHSVFGSPSTIIDKGKKNANKGAARSASPARWQQAERK